YAVEPCRAIDLGCGSGKSALWLAAQGFDVLGIDLSPAAIEIAERSSRDRSGSAARRTGRREGSARFVCGRYPEDFLDSDLPPGSFGLVTERGFLQHQGGSGMAAVLERTRRIMEPDALFYSLITAREGASGFWGPRRWTESEIRDAVERYFRIEEMKLSVFTPGEEGSIPAWITVMRPRS
ncbi:class I SAM-dependent methyltransferase, partial [Salinispira pacifica]